MKKHGIETASDWAGLSKVEGFRMGGGSFQILARSSMLAFVLRVRSVGSCLVRPCWFFHGSLDSCRGLSFLGSIFCVGLLEGL